jgi:hypothetical protein
VIHRYRRTIGKIPREAAGLPARAAANFTFSSDTAIDAATQRGAVHPFSTPACASSGWHREPFHAEPKTPDRDLQLRTTHLT